ncbi:MAG: hypothetical protein RR555_02620 [Bacteroidales bacterium]
MIERRVCQKTDTPAFFYFPCKTHSKESYTNFPLGVFASSVLHFGVRAILPEEIYDVNKLIEEEDDAQI